MATVNGRVPPGLVVRELPLARDRGPDFSSSADLQLRDTGDLVLYCADGGYPVLLQIAEDCTIWEQWYTVAAADVPSLGGGPAPFLEKVRDAVGFADGSPDAIKRFTGWLRERGIAYESAERINYD
jgi:hypothetical protein